MNVEKPCSSVSKIRDKPKHLFGKGNPRKYLGFREHLDRKEEQSQIETRIVLVKESHSHHLISFYVQSKSKIVQFCISLAQLTREMMKQWTLTFIEHEMFDLASEP